MFGRRRTTEGTIRTGDCTACGQPVTATQSSTDTRRWTGRHDLTHLNARDCAALSADDEPIGYLLTPAGVDYLQNRSAS